MEVYKQISFGVVTFFVLLFVYSKIASPIPFYVTQASADRENSFTVSGEGIVDVAPDLAIVNAGVSVEASTVSQAQSGLNERINRITEAMKNLSIKAEDIKTAYYSINPRYDYNEGRPRVSGYQASSTVVVKVRDIDRVNEAIDVATQNGANQIGNIQFEVDNKDGAIEEARKKAVEQAKKKAEQAAKIAGFRLGSIVSYSEDGAQPPMVFRQEKAMSMDSATSGTQVEPGTNEIRVNVVISYSLLP